MAAGKGNFLGTGLKLGVSALALGAVFAAIASPAGAAGLAATGIETVVEFGGEALDSFF